MWAPTCGGVGAGQNWYQPSAELMAGLVRTWWGRCVDTLAVQVAGQSAWSVGDCGSWATTTSAAGTGSTRCGCISATVECVEWNSLLASCALRASLLGVCCFADVACK
jgi:hypothetical protein